ncbi:uncharacterized protein DDB_G0289917-like [Metopolophium dirhodum]|nr:uncharacterized protein DDB_G0289917-like [Metopolophium dirhodum]
MSESDSSDIDTSSADSSIKVENYKSRKELKEAVLKDAVKKEFLEQTRKHIVKTVKKKLVRTHSLTEQIGTAPRKQTVGRLGTRSDSSVIHVQLESVVKKKMSKMDLDKAIAMIPICTGKKDVAEFINICEIAIKETTEADTPILLKIITSKLTGNALEVTKYRNLETWGAIKTILEGAFEQKVSERALSIALNTARMAEGESVAKFASRIEELYYKLCAASTIGLAQAEADIVKKQTKKQAMIIFMTGLPHHLYTVLKSRNPSTLEQCFKTAIDEMLEYESKVEMDKLQRQIGNGKQADVNNEEKRQNGGNTNNAVNRGGNGNSNQSNRNNNFNGYNNRYVNHNNRNNYGNNNQSGYGSHMVNRGGQRGGNGYGRNFNGNNVQQNNINRSTGCYTCGRSNHIARDCWSNRPNAQQNTYNNNRVNGTRHANNNNNVRRDNNNTQGVLCSYCNKIGHEISTCYTKQKNERSTSGNANGPSPVGVRLVQEIVQDPHTGFSTSQQN